MHERLRGVEAKLHRAKRHAQDVDALVQSLLQPHVYALEEEIDLDAGQNVLRRKLVRELPMEELGVLIGDCLHDLRSALDHIVWQLVESNGKRPSRRVQFR